MRARIIATAILAVLFSACSEQLPETAGTVVRVSVFEGDWASASKSTFKIAGSDIVYVCKSKYVDGCELIEEGDEIDFGVKKTTEGNHELTSLEFK